MRSWRSTESTIFSGLVSRTSLRSLGSCTGIDVVTTGIVIRKMISSTSMTSTSGVVLIVETISSSSALEEPTRSAMASGPGRSGSDFRGAQQHGMKIGAEAAHQVHRRLVAADQPVVTQNRRNGDCQAERRHDQRFADGARHLVDRRLPGNAYRRQRVVDAPYRAEQPDEGRRRADGGQKGQTILRARLDVVDRSLDRHRDPGVEIDVAQQADVLARRLESRFGDKAIRAALLELFGALAHRRRIPERAVGGARLAV